MSTGYWKFKTYNVFETESLSTYALEQTPLLFKPTDIYSEKYSNVYVIWDFGDGSTPVKSLSSQHFYFYPGEYYVTMTLMLSTSNSVLDTYRQKVTIYNFVPNSFGFKPLSGIYTNSLELTAGVISPTFTLESFNSLQSYDSNGYSFFLNCSGSNSLYYDFSKLDKQPYAHLLPTHRFIERKMVVNDNEDTVYSDKIIDKLNLDNTFLYGKLDSNSLVVATSSTDVNAFFVGTSGYGAFNFIDDSLNDNNYYIFATLDTSNFPDNFTNYYKIDISSDLPIKNTYSSYKTIDKNLYSKPEFFNFTSNGLGGDGLADSTFNINPSQFINKQISFVINLKNKNFYDVKSYYNFLTPSYLQFALNNVRVDLVDVFGNKLGDIENYVNFDYSLFEDYRYGWVKGSLIVPEDNNLQLTLNETYLPVFLSASSIISGPNNSEFFVGGQSSGFFLYPNEGVNKIAKINENFDTSNYLKSLALQPSVYKKPALFDTFFSTALGTLSSTTNTVGKRIYEKTSNFIPNNVNLDTCNLNALYNYAIEYNIDMDEFVQSNLLINYPADLARLMNIFTIKKSLLFGTRNKYQFNFADRYIQQQRPNDFESAAYNYSVGKDRGNNLGDEIRISDGIINKSDEYVVSYEHFSETYTIQRTNLSFKSDTYPLSTLDSSWGWNLVLPGSFWSDSLSAQKLSSFYTFYKFVPVVPGKWDNNLINWDDEYQTTLPVVEYGVKNSPYSTQYLSNYYNTSLSDWDTNNGIIEQNLTYQLSLGLELLSTYSN
jgi:hypothetical protein